MAAPDLARLREELQVAASASDETERLLEVAAIVAEALTDLEAELVVVGGLALAYWSESTFRTGDIDVVVARPPELAERMAALGFERPGREWLLPGYDVVFEAPGEALEPGDEARVVELASGRRLRVLSLEDLLLWRLRERIHWHVPSGFEQAAHLLEAAPAGGRLDRRAGCHLPSPSCVVSLRESPRDVSSRPGNLPRSARESRPRATLDEMSEEDLSYAAWRIRRGRNADRLARLNAGLPPYRRERLRGAVEAEVLRRAGTPDALIGPVGSDDEVERQRAELIAFARQLRSANGR